MDLKELERYIVIPVDGADVQAHAEHDLRVMDGEVEPGVQALWCEDESTVLAFLFDGRFTEEQAREWMKEKESEGINLVLQTSSPTYFRRLFALLKDYVPKPILVAASTLARAEPAAQPIAATTVGGRWFVQSAKGFSLAPEERAWQWNSAKQNAILDAGGWAMYARAHLVVDLDARDEGQRWPESKAAYKLPVAELIDGKLNYVWKAAVAANGALHGARTRMTIPAEAKEAASRTVAAIYKKFDKDAEGVALESFTDISNRVEAALTKLYEYEDANGIQHRVWVSDIGPDTVIFEMDNLYWSVPYTVNEGGDILLGELTAAERTWKERDTDRIIELVMYAFPVRGALATEAGEDVVGDDGGLLWKEVCKVGQWFKPATGQKIEITKQLLQDLVASFVARVVPNVSVPADDHHYERGGVVPAEVNTGFVEKLKLVGQSLWAGFKFTDEATRDKIEEGSIKDVSIYAAPNVHDPRTGEKWPWVLMHVLLTNFPQIQGLAPFGEEPVAADATTGTKVIFTEVMNMPDNDAVTLSAEQAAQFESLQALGLSTEQVTEWQSMGLSFERIKALIAEEEATRSKARELEVQAILLALQGQGEHDGVAQVDNTRHYPVVCAAVEKALKEQPLALDFGGNGKADLDAVVLGIVNAIPAEGRMSLTPQPSGSKEPHQKGLPSDEQIDQLDERLQ